MGCVAHVQKRAVEPRTSRRARCSARTEGAVLLDAITCITQWAVSNHHLGTVGVESQTIVRKAVCVWASGVRPGLALLKGALW